MILSWRSRSRKPCEGAVRPGQSASLAGSAMSPARTAHGPSWQNSPNHRNAASELAVRSIPTRIFSGRSWCTQASKGAADRIARVGTGDDSAISSAVHPSSHRSIAPVGVQPTTTNRAARFVANFTIPSSGTPRSSSSSNTSPSCRNRAASSASRGRSSFMSRGRHPSGNCPRSSTLWTRTRFSCMQCASAAAALAASTVCSENSVTHIIGFMFVVRGPRVHADFFLPCSTTITGQCVCLRTRLVVLPTTSS